MLGGQDRGKGNQFLFKASSKKRGRKEKSAAHGRQIRPESNTRLFLVSKKEVALSLWGTILPRIPPDQKDCKEPHKILLKKRKNKEVRTWKKDINRKSKKLQSLYRRSEKARAGKSRKYFYPYNHTARGRTNFLFWKKGRITTETTTVD